MDAASQTRKRPRRWDQPAPDDARRKRAQAISAKFRKKYPYKEYGVAYFKRGTPENIERFGETYKTATEDQKTVRKGYGYSGRGSYNFLRSTSNFTRGLGNIALSRLSGGGLYTGRGGYNDNGLIAG